MVSARSKKVGKLTSPVQAVVFRERQWEWFADRNQPNIHFLGYTLDSIVYRAAVAMCLNTFL